MATASPPIPGTSISGQAGAAPRAARQLAPLTGLRFLAALLVVLHHYWGDLLNSYGERNDPRVPTLIGSGYVGVNFFFLLSGFILAYNYLGRDGRLRVSKRDFWVARFARIYPVYLAAFLIAAPPSIHFILAHAGSIMSAAITGLTSLLLVHAWIPRMADVWNGPSWSLSAEAFFYLVFPVAGAYLARASRRTLWIAVGACWVIALAFPLLLYPLVVDSHGHWNQTWHAVAKYNPLIQLPEFLMGIALGRIFVTTPRRSSHGSAGRPFAPALLSVGALVGIVVALSYVPIFFSAHWALVYLLMHNGLIDPLFALLIYCLAFDEGPLAKALSLPVVTLLGEASYGLYILHIPLLDWMKFVAPGLRNNHYVLFCLVHLALAVGLSVISLSLLETPTRRWIRRALAGRRQRVGASASPSAPPEAAALGR